MTLDLTPLRTERLVLPLWTAADVAAIRLGRRTPDDGALGEWHPEFPRRDDQDASTLWHDGDPYGPRSIVRGVTVLGSIGFFGPPDEAGELEVGYGLVRDAWGWGFATESLRAMLDAIGPEVTVRASIEPENKASLRVAAKCGFTQLRGATPDGELVMVRAGA
ncbi:GNAT family N-acetyltransferase [Nocardioides nematodiphilus]|uniref:GNAT family N-acetyltransferase n=1 Tax=Nocardioides nematodiphilus TaxID=2849669 RepID=UPI001CD9F2CB|nr:GNAT family N-acetyltransferase [Nocardioides nematodiphilus]MCA1984342.1 GNAT family N-acetyltransferase [Nocardioides nematodiphilus]